MVNYFKGILFILISIPLLSCYLFGQDIKYKLFKSEQLSEPAQTWCFESIPQSGIIVVKNDEINWFGTSKSIALPSCYVNTIFSRLGKYLGIISVIETSKQIDNDKLLKLELFSSTGELFYIIKRQLYYDEPLPAIIISDKDGSVVWGYSVVGKLLFFDQKGNQIKEIHLFSDDEYALERVLKLHISDNGNEIVVLINKRPASTIDADVPRPSGEPYLFLFTAGGKQMWHHPLPEFCGGQVAISPDGKYLVASSYSSDTKGDIKKSTILLNNEGNELDNYDMLFHLANFSNDSKYVIIAEKTIVSCLELTTNKIKWTYKIPFQNKIITAVNLSDDAEISVILVAKSEFKDNAFIYTNPRLVVLNQWGEKIQTIDIDKEFNTPVLNISPDHKLIAVGFKDSYEIYELDSLLQK